MPQFNDSTGSVLLPECDAKFEVVEFDQGVSSGGKTGGSTKYELKLRLESTHGNGTTYENLIDHESTAWKIDMFLKSAGVKIAKGDSFEFRQEDAANHDCRFIAPVGLRGWCRVVVDEYQGKKRNKIATFYTDKEKLPPNQIAAEDSEF